MKYEELTLLYVGLNSTTKRLEKTKILADFLRNVNSEEIADIVLLVQGRIYPQWNSKEIGVSTKLIIKAVSLSSGLTAEKIENEWKKKGDLGETCSSILSKKSQASLFKEELDVVGVLKELRKIAEMSGAGSTDNKVKSISKLLGNASQIEIKFLIRTILEDMRTGVSEGILRDAIVWAFFEKEAKIAYSENTKSAVLDSDRAAYTEIVSIIQGALDISNDYSEIARISKENGLNGLKEISITVGKPLKLMLFPKVSDAAEAFSVVGTPAAFEYKYDGFRVQVHRKGEAIRIFTRRLDEVTVQFPDLIKEVKSHIYSKEFILDAEVVGFNPKSKEYMPFQSISQRIRRKYDIEDMAKKFPVELNIFDILFLDGKTLVNEPFFKRREEMVRVVKEEDKKVVLARQIVTKDPFEAMEFYSESLKKGFEGVMAKNLNASYRPGRWVGYGVKLKPVMEELDLVIVKAEWGTGKRGQWLTSYTVACYYEDELVEIGKVSTGLKEVEGEEGGVTYAEMTDRLKPLILSEEGKETVIKPEVILEVHYEEIQKSPTYTSGYALRFPRIVRVRDDKALEEIATIDQIDILFKKQKR